MGNHEEVDATTSTHPIQKVENERMNFRALLLSNPNYFGTIEKSSYKPIKPISKNITYEEIKCIGFNPQFSRLEAVVWIKQKSGYGGGICSSGTPEYIRFYLSFDNGATWKDQGLVGFTAYDIAATSPLEYAVTIQVNIKKDICLKGTILPKVRAILSWNHPPNPNDPGYLPVWGNIVEARIQIDALRLILLKDFLVESQVKISDEFKAILDLEQPLIAAKPKELSTADLQLLNKDKKVPEHRLHFAQVHKLIANPELTESLMIADAKVPLSEMNIDLSKIIGAILNTNGNTEYEELKCIGLNPNQDSLIGVITLKLASGYSGNLCSAGSHEYVAFWVDWGDGAGWTYAGTSSVNVHDINTIPPEGLQYSVFLPINLSSRRQPCGKGAKMAKVRAILSWQVSPPSNPNYVPVWGNRKETLIHIAPGPAIPPEGHTPLIETVGNMAVTSIDNVTGLANGLAVGAGFTAKESPFGYEIVMTGHIANPPNMLGGGATPFKYRVSVTNDPGPSPTWHPLTNNIAIWLTQLANGIWTGPTYFEQKADSNGWYEYHEDLISYASNDPMQFVAQNVLARWQTGPGMTGLWKIKIEAFDPKTNAIYPGAKIITVCLDNTAPLAEIAITSGAGPCGDFKVGEKISGTYKVSDEHFGSLWLSIQPALGGSFTSPSPLPRTYPIVSTLGESGTWELKTDGMPPCGYVIYLGVYDRTIVNSGYVGLYGQSVVGFCLRKKTD